MTRLLWWLCAVLDRVPILVHDEDGRWRVYRSALGCRLGLSERALTRGGLDG